MCLLVILSSSGAFLGFNFYISVIPLSLLLLICLVFLLHICIFDLPFPIYLCLCRTGFLKFRRILCLSDLMFICIIPLRAWIGGIIVTSISTIASSCFFLRCFPAVLPIVRLSILFFLLYYTVCVCLGLWVLCLRCSPECLLFCLD